MSKPSRRVMSIPRQQAKSSPSGRSVPWVAIAAGGLALVYPVVVYLGLTRFSARTVGLGLLVLATARLSWRLFRSGPTRRWQRLWTPATLAVLAAMVIATNTTAGVLVVPVVISGGLLLVFASTLRTPQPLVERLARQWTPDLSPAEIRYCRHVTWAWCLFFLLNGSVAAGMAALAPLTWWTAYNGFLAYLLMGALFTGEYLLRKYRFRRYGSHLHDRIFARLWPPRRPSP